MAIIVMVYGQSGTGKSASLRNFDPAKVAVINVSGKPMPFRTEMKTFNTDRHEQTAALPADRIVYFLGHSEVDQNGNEKFKTIGRLLDEKVTLEGKYTIVLKTVVQDGKYLFSTHNNGQDTVKTPIGMFENDLIPNDLAAVDKVIREYYGMEE